MINVPTTAIIGAFGQPAVIDDGQTGARTITILFDEPFEAVSEYSATIEMTAPVATVESSEIATVTTHGATLTTGGKDYTITGVQPDGSGLTKLILKEA